MRLILITLLLAATLGAFAQKHLLVYYRAEAPGYIHENRLASVEALRQLCETDGYQVSSYEDPSIFHPDSLARFDGVVFSNTNAGAFVTDQQRTAFQDYMRQGGRFVGIHSASTSAPDWPWYWAMVGGKFVRHPKLQPFTLAVIDPNHPATSFMESTMEWTDECYFLNQINPDIHILLAADLRSITDEGKNEYPGDTFGHYAPLAWYHEFEGGRQFYTALGHKPAHYQDAFFLKHILGGIRWVLEE